MISFVYGVISETNDLIIFSRVNMRQGEYSFHLYIFQTSLCSQASFWRNPQRRVTRIRRTASVTTQK